MADRPQDEAATRDRGGARTASSVTFVSGAAQEDDVRGKLGLAKQTIAVQGTRGIGKADMILNDPPRDQREPRNL